MGPDPIVKEVFIEASPETVFSFLTEPEKMLQWMGVRAEIEPRPGGIYFLDPNGRDVIRGSYLQVVPHSRIVFTWGWEAPGHRVPAGSTVVEIDLEPKDKGTLVRLVHRKLPSEAHDNHQLGWTHYLGRLKSVSEGGNPGVDPFANLSVHHG